MNDIYLVNKIMERSNRFDESLINSSAHRKTSAQRVKEIYIQNEANDDDTRPLRIGMNKTVKDLKREIEKLVNYYKNCRDKKIDIERIKSFHKNYINTIINFLNIRADEKKLIKNKITKLEEYLQ